MNQTVQKNRKKWQRFGAKLIVLVVATSSLAIAVVAPAMGVAELVSLRRTAVDNLRTQADIVATHSTAALLFDDADAGLETLQSFKSNRNVIHACILDAHGEVFASYEGPRFSGDDAIATSAIASNEALFEGSTVVVAHDIFESDEYLGQMVIRLDLASVFIDIRRDMLMAAVFGVGALTLSVILALRLQRHLTGQVDEIIVTTQRIAETGDLSHRAVRLHNDELGDVSEAFNDLLDQVQRQQSELERAQVELEDRVAERTRDVAEAMDRATEAADSLAETQIRFELAIDGSNDGLWDYVPNTGSMWYSPRFREILEYEGHDLVGFPGKFDSLREAIHRDNARQFTRGLDRLLHQGDVLDVELQVMTAAGDYRWVRIRGASVQNAHGYTTRAAGSMSDIHARKQAELEREELSRQLVDASREAGKSEVASGVLHNVGNALNSINTSTNLIAEQLGRSKREGLSRLVQLLEDNKERLGDFIENDDRGKIVPQYLATLAEHLEREQDELLGEITTLRSRVDHVKEVITSQQRYARNGSSAVLEKIRVQRLVDEAWTMVQSSRSVQEVEFITEIPGHIVLLSDRNGVLQVLVNLTSNAVDSVREQCPDNPQIVISVAENDEGTVDITVRDNGIGISPDGLTRIFSHGFTTKKNGHGFGLHMSALTARELGGQLDVTSDGLGEGAAFTLQLPLAPNDFAMEKTKKDGEQRAEDGPKHEQHTQR